MHPLAALRDGVAPRADRSPPARPSRPMAPACRAVRRETGGCEKADAVGGCMGWVSAGGLLGDIVADAEARCEGNVFPGTPPPRLKGEGGPERLGLAHAPGDLSGSPSPLRGGGGG